MRAALPQGLLRTTLAVTSGAGGRRDHVLTCASSMWCVFFVPCIRWRHGGKGQPPAAASGRRSRSVGGHACRAVSTGRSCLPCSGRSARPHPPCGEDCLRERFAVSAALCAGGICLALCAATAAAAVLGPMCLAQVRQLGGQACLPAHVGEEFGHGDGPVLPPVAVEGHQRIPRPEGQARDQLAEHFVEAAPVRR